MSADLVVGRAFTGEAVAGADPLAFDAHVPSLALLNKAGDTGGLLRLLALIVPRPQDLAALGAAECAAAMRDLGMVMGSLRRHAVEPVRALPATAPVLQLLGERTGMVPRDTVVHYTVWNPCGLRERTHTGSREESAMLAALRWYVCAVAEAAGAGVELARLAVEDECFPVVADRVSGALREATVALDAFALDVPPAFFADVLRPYYDAIDVDGASYPGPSPAHAPLPALDRVLWACDAGLNAPAGYWSVAAAHALPSWRPWYAQGAAGPSLVTRVTAGLARGEGMTAARALREVLSALLRFRGKHLTLARRAYPQRDAAHRAGEPGSVIGLLADITDLTRENKNLLVRMTVGGEPPARA
jgi:hypothetical protein